MKDQIVTKLPKLDFDHLETVMAERIAATATPYTPVPMLWQGLLKLEIPVEQEMRSATLYVPEDTPQGTPFVLLNVPEGKETLPFLRESGWLDNADRFGICLFVLEPAVGGWKSPEEEQAYFNACLDAEKDGVYLRGSLSVHVVGYGSIGTAMHRLALSQPLMIASAVFVNASEIAEDELAAYASRSLDVFGYQYGMVCGEIPVPVWIVSHKKSRQTEAVVGYWSRVIGAGAPVENADFGLTYMQAKDSVCTPEGNITKVCVCYADEEPASGEICRFLLQYARYGSVGPYANTLVRSVDYDAIGVQFKYFTDRNGIRREYLEYVPKAFRDRGEKLPLVLAIHGASESIRNYFEESLWYQKADQEGFVIVMPEVTLTPLPSILHKGVAKAYRCLWQTLNPDTRHMDLDYLEDLLERVQHGLPIDKTRMYMTGHSMGCMMTTYVGSTALSHRFTALGATSGPLMFTEKTGTQAIPTFLTMGQYDLWPYALTEEGPLEEMVDFWLIRNGLATAKNVQAVRSSGSTREYVDGRYHHYVWCDAAGTPLVRYAWVKYKNHLNTPEENFMLWDQWFSKWKFDANGNRFYQKDI